MMARATVGFFVPFCFFPFDSILVNRTLMLQQKSCCMANLQFYFVYCYLLFFCEFFFFLDCFWELFEKAGILNCEREILIFFILPDSYHNTIIKIHFRDFVNLNAWNIFHYIKRFFFCFCYFDTNMWHLGLFSLNFYKLKSKEIYLLVIFVAHKFRTQFSNMQHMFHITAEFFNSFATMDEYIRHWRDITHFQEEYTRFTLNEL